MSKDVRGYPLLHEYFDISAMVMGQAKQKYTVLGRGLLMAKNENALTFTFVNPNTQEAFENTLKKIIIDKLLSQPLKTATANS